MYVDTSIEPWPGVYANPMLKMRDRTNFVIREKALHLAAERGELDGENEAHGDDGALDTPADYCTEWRRCQWQGSRRTPPA